MQDQRTENKEKARGEARQGVEVGNERGDGVLVVRSKVVWAQVETKRVGKRRKE